MIINQNTKGFLTVSPDERLDALAAALAEPVHHEEQQGQDEEGGDAADDEPHAAGHGVKQIAAVWDREIGGPG